MSHYYEIKRYNVSPSFLNERREIFEHPIYYDPKKYKNNSRYSKLRLLFDNETGKYFHENWIQKVLKKTSEDQYYTVTKTDENRLDIVSNYYYSTPRYWWVIAMANYIMDPFDIPVGTVLRIPPLVTIYDEGGVVRG